MPPILIGREDVVADFSEGLANGAGAPGRLMLISGQRGYGKTVLLVELARVAKSYGWDVVHRPSDANLKKMKPGTGILFAIDEAQAADTGEMVALATAVQKLASDAEKHGIALVFAGLPSLVDELVNDKVLTFLRRAMRENLGSIRLPDVRNAYVTRAAEDARMVFLDAVCAPAYKGLTKAQQAFLEAMLVDWPGPSSVAEIGKRLGKSRSWANAYRKSLISASMIEPASLGEVAYAIPHFAEYLQNR